MSSLDMDYKASNVGWEVFDEDRDEDALSLCDLTTMQEYYTENNGFSSALHSSITNEFFEFSNELSKSMLQEEEELNEYQKRDYLSMIKSDSFRKPSSFQSNLEVEDPTHNKSLRFTSSKSETHSSSYHHQVQKVNISSLTSMSAKSRRRMFMFGPVKFKPEMELSAIKERQGKRLTTLLSPPTVLDGGKAVVNDGRKRGSSTKSSGSHWGVAKSSMRGRAHLSNVLTRSFVFGCIPAGSIGSGNWVKLAN